MTASDLRSRARWLAAAARADGDDGAAAAARRLDEWIAARPSGPFFWFVNLVECHSPYLPPRPYAGLGPIGRMRAAAEASRWLTMGAFWRACVTGNVPGEGALERMRAGYRGAVSYMDAWLGRVLESLDAAGLLEGTLVIVSSDHGENFGEGRLIGHGFSLDQRLIEVPFVVAGPGAERLQDIRSLAEVPARLAELAELSDHPYDPEDIPPLPVAQFDSPAPPRDDPRTVEAVRLWQLGEAEIETLTTPLTAAVDGTLKLVVRGTRETFHDLATDPLELHPLSADAVDAEAAARLRAALEHPAAAARDTRLQTVLAHEPAADEDGDVADLEERMRLLGYL
jgi:arylsulfatase A-like enzyme